jgi:hypothetical protein
MRGEAVVKALLEAYPGVTAIVSTRIQPAPLPETLALPAIATRHITTIDLPTIDAQSYGLVRSRIEVTAVTKTYPVQKQLLEQVRLALQYRRGTIAGYEVVSVVRDNVGPDLRDDDKMIFSQSVDFVLTLKEV